ncbi:hypothetical protein [Halomonas ramblicola]|uniref:hypothetical protein n=1 Tax=Halomonas ramblicola TaxID=747349 RepID=UPI0025B2EEA7|nr:hypothetical protein [Halomonas ramblicola]MDN3523519.1 hypothetical protein [Halomonas ramblicola]
MAEPQPLNIRLDAGTVRRLEQLQRQINAELPEGVMPPFSLAALARHSIRKWCDQQFKPMPNPCLTEEQQREEERKLAQEREELKKGGR